MTQNKCKIAIIGLGYVGLPLAIEFSKYYSTVGYDKNLTRIKELNLGIDNTNEIENKTFNKNKKLIFTNKSNDIRLSNIYIITVPTPVNKKKQPDLSLIKSAIEIVSKHIKKNDIIILESTVYPGVSEEFCIPLIERLTDKKINKDFFFGYSPERVNPGDKKRTLTKIKKVVSGSNSQSTKKINNLYKKIITAGTYVASSIKVAEAAKVIENTQRDINIAFINELSLIFNKLNINTNEVLKAASTKWNFIDFKPGLVGGHCISVDPHYLAHKSRQVGYNPKIILSGRNINDNMSKNIANESIKKIKSIGLKRQPRVLVMGITFKENCPDIRNTQVVKIIKIFINKKFNVDVIDGIADNKLIKKEYKINMILKPKKNYYDFILLAVKHDLFYKIGIKKIRGLCNKNGFIYDLKSMFNYKDVDLSL